MFIVFIFCLFVCLVVISVGDRLFFFIVVGSIIYCGGYFWGDFDVI